MAGKSSKSDVELVELRPPRNWATVRLPLAANFVGVDKIRDLLFGNQTQDYDLQA